MVRLQTRRKRRHKKHPNSHAREVALQALYQVDVADSTEADVLAMNWLNEPLEPIRLAYCERLIRGVLANRAELDRWIIEHSRKDMTQISTIIRNILRMGIWELRIGEIASSIIIDDQLNLTRIYEGEEAVPFVNGILDTHLNLLFPEKEAQESAESGDNLE